MTPDCLMVQDEAALRATGMSRQKVTYARELAKAVASGTLNLTSLSTMESSAARAALTGVKGIGEWTATIYQMLAILHPDVWPHGDRALALSVRNIMGLRTVPDQKRLERLGRRYKPWRSVAARLYWYHYLDGGNPQPDGEPAHV